MRQATITSQNPRVGSLAKLHGHVTLQLHASKASPRIRHAVLASAGPTSPRAAVLARTLPAVAVPAGGHHARRRRRVAVLARTLPAVARKVRRENLGRLPVSVAMIHLLLYHAEPHNTRWMMDGLCPVAMRSLL